MSTTSTGYNVRRVVIKQWLDSELLEPDKGRDRLHYQHLGGGVGG